MTDDGIPIIGNQYRLQTILRKLHLEPNDIIVVRDQNLTPDDLCEALQGYSCGHSSFACKGHRVVFAPDGIESCSVDLLKALIASKEVTQ